MSQLQTLSQGDLVQLRSGTRMLVEADQGEVVHGFLVPLRRFGTNRPTVVLREQIERVIERETVEVGA